MMAVEVKRVKISPIAYNAMSEQDNNIVFGNNFSCEKPFLLLSGKPIPRYSKVYMEVTVTQFTSNPNIRFVPLYVGVHKEPSFGVLNSDFCIGSTYYQLNGSILTDYDVMERYHADGYATHQTVDTLYAKIPLQNTVIGIGVDMCANTISIFSDGRLFYSFSPLSFHINNEPDDFYFAIHGSLAAHIAGVINFGQYRTKYLPEGYWDLYQAYYDKLTESNEIDCIFVCEDRYGSTDTGEQVDTGYVNGSIDPENDIAPVDPDTHQRHIHLIHRYPEENTFTTDTTFLFAAKTPSSTDDTRDMTTVNLPCPVDQKIYIEFAIREGVMKTDYLGVPISIGVSSDINDLSKQSFRLHLWHERFKRYEYVTTVDGVSTTYQIEYVSNACTPTQPDTIGAIFDLANNEISIMTGGTLFVTVKIPDMDFSKLGTLAYIFFSCDDDSISDTDIAYDRSLHGICNFGEDLTEYTVPDDTMTLYYYYNYIIKYPLPNPPEILCVLSVLPYKVDFSKYIFSKIYVSAIISDEESKFSPGLNKAFDTYNVITDTEERNNQPVMSIFDFHQLMTTDFETINDRRIRFTREIDSTITVEPFD